MNVDGFELEKNRRKFGLEIKQSQIGEVGFGG